MTVVFVEESDEIEFERADFDFETGLAPAGATVSTLCCLFGDSTPSTEDKLDDRCIRAGGFEFDVKSRAKAADI